MASAYVDPGSGAMIWQMAAAAVIGSLFYVKRIFTWAKKQFSLGSPLAMGFAFATLFALVACPVTVMIFANNPLPRFNDLFLIGVVLTAYFFRWEPALYLLGISLLVSAWILPPTGSFHLAGPIEWYRILSFGLVSLLLVCIVSRSKARKQAEERAPSYSMHGAAAGAD